MEEIEAGNTAVSVAENAGNNQRHANDARQGKARKAEISRWQWA
ncbi:MAG: hypothetical protein Fur0021_20770 [Candidatus Promineifilaceae bacterium]